MSMDSRRTVRLPTVIPVEISYTDHHGQAVLERTETKDIDRHGARLRSLACHPVGSKICIGITQLGRSAHTRVVWCSAPINGAYEVGVELEGAEDFWGVSFTESRWQTDMDPATTLWTLVRMLDEKGVINREDLRARVIGSAQPSVPGTAVPWMNRRV